MEIMVFGGGKMNTKIISIFIMVVILISILQIRMILQKSHKELETYKALSQKFKDQMSIITRKAQPATTLQQVSR